MFLRKTPNPNTVQNAGARPSCRPGHQPAQAGFATAAAGFNPSVILALIILALTSPAFLRADTPPSSDRAAQTEQLIHKPQENYAAALDLVRTQPDTAFEIVRSNWQTIATPSIRQTLLYLFTATDNPHVLDVLHLAVADPDPSVKYQVFDLLQNYAFRNFNGDPEGYRQWHQKVETQPLEDVVRAGCQDLMARLAAVDHMASGAQSETARDSLLATLMRVDFSGTSPLAKIRRQIAQDNHLLDLLARWLSLPGSPNVNVLYVLRNFQPDEDYVRRIIVPLSSKNNPTYIRYAAAGIIGTVKSRWAADLLVRMLVEESPTTESWIFLQPLSNTTDPHLMPTLIALLEADDRPETGQMLNYALRRLASMKAGEMHDGGWWHVWWDRSKTHFPEDVRTLSIPKIALKQPENKEYSYSRRRLEWHQIDGDPQRTYWLVCPGYLGPPVPTASSKSRPAGPSSPPPAFGLVVVLAGGSGNGEDLTDFWLDAVQKALKDHYFVALPIAPRWSDRQSTPWITQHDRDREPEARFTTETFVDDIITNVSAKYAIDRNRLFLHGVGEGGLAAYALSLDAVTPFKGFYIVASPFKSAQLPPLSHALHRRYFIHHSKEDRVIPYWEAVAAEEMLKKQSAAVKLAPYKGEHGYKFQEDAWARVAEAFAWLETGK